MKTRSLATFLVALLLSYLVVPPTPQLRAKPILKPRKYHGPIPRKSLTLSIGFLGGADSEDMWGFLDRSVDDPFKRFLSTDDFSTGLQADLTYTVKMHPQFAFRLKGGAGFLSSESVGKAAVLASPADTISTLVSFVREFDVVLLSVEGSAIYYFQDASVDEFQTYLGGGFSTYFPLASFDETFTDDATGLPFPGGRDVSKNSANPGVHAILGFLYHLKNSVAVHLEGRVQIAQSKIEIPAQTAPIPLSFDVDYTGFVLNVGVSKFF
ncbi:MAG: hypothetical protein ACE5EO_07960 [Candidatus Krumholzibacteriia bacterium]